LAWFSGFHQLTGSGDAGSALKSVINELFGMVFRLWRICLWQKADPLLAERFSDFRQLTESTVDDLIFHLAHHPLRETGDFSDFCLASINLIGKRGVSPYNRD